METACACHVCTQMCQDVGGIVTQANEGFQGMDRLPSRFWVVSFWYYFKSESDDATIRFETDTFSSTFSSVTFCSHLAQMCYFIPNFAQSTCILINIWRHGFSNKPPFLADLSFYLHSDDSLHHLALVSTPLSIIIIACSSEFPLLSPLIIPLFLSSIFAYPSWTWIIPFPFLICLSLRLIFLSSHLFLLSHPSGIQTLIETRGSQDVDLFCVSVKCKHCTF